MRAEVRLIDNTTEQFEADVVELVSSDGTLFVRTHYESIIAVYAAGEWRKAFILRSPTASSTADADPF